MQSKNSDKTAEILLDLTCHIETTLLKHTDLAQDKAKKIGEEISQKIAHDWGGLMVYIPKNLMFIISERDKQIYAEFNGYNQRELAKKYNLSIQWVYKIIASIQKQQQKHVQLDMFEQEINKSI